MSEVSNEIYDLVKLFNGLANQKEYLIDTEDKLIEERISLEDLDDISKYISDDAANEGYDGYSDVAEIKKQANKSIEIANSVLESMSRYETDISRNESRIKEIEEQLSEIEQSYKDIEKSASDIFVKISDAGYVDEIDNEVVRTLLG